MRGTSLSMALLQSFFMANRSSAQEALDSAPAFADSVRTSVGRPTTAEAVTADTAKRQQQEEAPRRRESKWFS